MLRDEERTRQKALTKVQQPESTIDPECVTCVISPPPKLVEAQTKEQRARDRKARLDEYEAQKRIAERLQTAKASPQLEQRLV